MLASTGLCNNSTHTWIFAWRTDGWLKCAQRDRRSKQPIQETVYSTGVTLHKGLSTYKSGHAVGVLVSYIGPFIICEKDNDPITTSSLIRHRRDWSCAQELYPSHRLGYRAPLRVTQMCTRQLKLTSTPLHAFDSQHAARLEHNASRWSL